MRRIIQGIKNIIAWLPYIWKDRQFDGAFIYMMLHHKLGLMYKFYSSDKCVSVVSPKSLKIMKLAMFLCHRIYSEDYAPFINEDFIVPGYFKGLPDYEYYMQKQDIKLLGKILRKHSLYWWN